MRYIDAPNKQLKYIQKRLSSILYDIYAPKKVVTGFVKGKSVVTNAQIHTNKKAVLNLDIENFFALFISAGFWEFLKNSHLILTIELLYLLPN